MNQHGPASPQIFDVPFSVPLVRRALAGPMVDHLIALHSDGPHFIASLAGSYLILSVLSPTVGCYDSDPLLKLSLQKPQRFLFVLVL